MKPPLPPALQHALVTYTSERKQEQFRLTLLREAERDLKNKKADHETAYEKTQAALAVLLAECDL